MLISIVAALLAGVGVTPSQAMESKPVYVFGVVPQFAPRRIDETWRPLLDALEARTDLRFELAGSPEIPQFESSLLRGAFDFAYINPYQAILGFEQQGYLPLVRDGSRTLSGIVVVRDDSPIRTPNDLRGVQVAFPAPNALGATLMVRASLSRLHATEVRPVFVKTHSSVYLHVAMGLTIAGGSVASTLAAEPEEVRGSLRVIFRTPSLTPHPVSAHPKVPTTHRDLVRQALIEIAGTRSGAALFAKIPMREPVEAEINDYASLTAVDLNAFLQGN